MEILKVLLPLLIEFAPMIIECIDKPEDPEPRLKLRDFASRWVKMLLKVKDPTDATCAQYALASGVVCMTHQSDERFKASCQRLNRLVVMGQKIVDDPSVIMPNGPNVTN